MKNKDTVSAIIGGVFFAVPYLVLSAPIVPSLVIGACAFGAGEMILTQGKKTLKETNISLYKTLEKAKRQNKHILQMIPNIEDEKIRIDLSEINESVTKIIATIEKNPKKVEKIGNFFDYYLPITVKIIDRYDDIENQKLNSSDSKKFLKSTNKMVGEANKAFKKILDDLYEKEIVDIDAEIKVFDSLLKADGFNENELSVKEGDTDE